MLEKSAALATNLNKISLCWNTKILKLKFYNFFAI